MSGPWPGTAYLPPIPPGTTLANTSSQTAPPTPQPYTTSGIPGPPGPVGPPGPASAPGFLASSSTSLTIAGGSQSFVTQSNLAYTPGARVRLSSSGSGAYMEGLVTAYNSSTGAMTVSVDTASGSGSHTDWNINAAGNVGTAGPAGAAGPPGAAGPAGMFTISDTPPASPSVGQGWWDSSTGQGYIWYTDANSSQWVVFNDQGPQGGPGPQGVAGPQGPTGAGTGFNKLINGFLEIDQANEGASPNIVPSSYIVDGFVGSMASGNSFAASGQRFSSGGPTGYPYGLVLSVSAGATVVAAGAAYQLYSNIEADELYDTQMGTTQAQPLTASFWAQASIAQT